MTIRPPRRVRVIADLGGEDAAQLRFEVLEVGARGGAPLTRARRLLALPPDELLRLANRELALEHDGQRGPLELGDA